MAAQQWVRLGGYGKFILQSEQAVVEASRAKITATEMREGNYEAWYRRVCNDGADTMLNVEVNSGRAARSHRLLTLGC